MIRLLAVVALLDPVRGWGHNGAVAIALPATGIVVDGRLDDWPAGLTRYPVTRTEVGSRPRDAEDLTAHFRLALDVERGALLVAVEARDESILRDLSTNRSWASEDGCEIYLDITHGDSSIAVQHFIRGGRVSPDRGEGGVVAAVGHGGGWRRYEWLVPLPLDLDAARTLSFDVAVADLDADSTFSWVAWGHRTAKVGHGDRRGDAVLVRQPSLGELTGQVRWSEDDEPIVDAGVFVRSLTTPDLWVRAETDAEGRYAIGLPPGLYEITVDAGAGADRRVELAAAGTTRVDVAIPQSRGTRRVAGPGTPRMAGGTHDGIWSRYGATDGLRASQVTSLAQAPSGVLWVGTLEGLLRFDGIAFVHYTTEDGLVDDRVHSLCVGRDGELWIGTGGGLVRFDGGAFRSYTTRDGLPDDVIRTLTEDRRGRLWVGTDGGLGRHAGERFVRVDDVAALRDPVVATVEDAAGGIWVATAGELVRLDADGEVERFRDRLGARVVRALAADAAGSVWIGTSNGLARYDGAGLTWTMDGPGSLPWRAVLRLLPDHRGRLWVATVNSYTIAAETRGALSLWDGRRFRHFTDDLGSPMVSALLEDREGNVWVGTANLLARHDVGEIVRLGRAAGLPSELTTALAEDGDGRLWVGTDAGLVIRRGPGQPFESVATAAGTGHRRVNDIIVDGAGRVWVASEGGRLTRYEGDDAVAADAGMPPNSPWQLHEDPAGILWVSTNGGGLCRVSATGVTVFGSADGLPSDVVGGLASGPQGDLWVTTWSSGISRFDGRAFHTYTQRDGLVSNMARVLLGAPGALWIGTAEGVSGYDGQAFTSLATVDGLAHSFVRAFLRDDRGLLWIGTSGGISRTDGELVQNLLLRDGFGDVIVNELLQDHAGDVWIATQGDGLIRYVPTDSPPPVDIVDVIAGKHLGAVAAVEMPTTQDLLGFEVRGLSFKTRPVDLRYRYRLVGWQDDWATTESPLIEYADLPAGEYRFEVQAIDRDLSRSPLAATVAVRVHWPYRALALWTALLAAVGLIAWQATQMVQRNRSLRRAYERLDRAHDELQTAQKERLEAERLRTLLEAAGGASHEINQPLQAITLSLELMRESLSAGTADADALRQSVAELLQETARVSQILERMRNVQRYRAVPYPGGQRIVDYDAASREDDADAAPPG